MAPISGAAYATLLMNDAYLPGAMVLGHSLRDRGAKGRLLAMVVIDKLGSNAITELKTVYDEIVPVQQIYNKTPANLYLMNRPDLISTFTKIELWRQTRFKRIVYMDADMVALRAPNELLTMDTQFAAVPDIGWPDCFNSGLLVLNPNMADYYALLALAERGISFDGADQGLLNMHFRDWERLSFTYNCTPSGNYQYVPAYKHFQSTISVVHFIGRDKPWTLGRDNRHSSGVYGELLGRWWAVYDRHYRSQEVVYGTQSYLEAPKKVQDYVRGEETVYLPAYAAPREEVSSASQPPQQQNQQFTPSQDTQSVSVHPPHEDQQSTMEQPMGDQPLVDEQIRNDEYVPTSTIEQRRWSAPHVDWEPSRAPPPTNSKPEASNFPSTIYEMSEDKALFQPPASYPEAPKDMWYEVPKREAPPSKPKPLFPWESRAPKPTRVFAEPKLPSPPPEPEVLFVEQDSARQSSIDATANDTDEAVAKDVAEANEAPVPVDTWATFNQRSNAWDDMPEIARYMQAINQNRKGKIQVLHHTPSSPSAAGKAGLTERRGRRESIKVTDFPTELERPSLPVTPAPVRRPTFWGEERDELGVLPNAQGVPKQDEWVRRFSSYPEPAFRAVSPVSQELNGVACFQCQYCGKQNPIARLEDLHRRQSEILLGDEGAEKLKSTAEPPKRELPGSSSKEEVVKAAEKAMSPPSKGPLKPILKEPSFEIPKQSDSIDITKDIRSPDEVDPMDTAATSVDTSMSTVAYPDSTTTNTSISVADSMTTSDTSSSAAVIDKSKEVKNDVSSTSNVPETTSDTTSGLPKPSDDPSSLTSITTEASSDPASGIHTSISANNRSTTVGETSWGPASELVHPASKDITSDSTSGTASEELSTKQQETSPIALGSAASVNSSVGVATGFSESSSKDIGLDNEHKGTSADIANTSIGLVPSTDVAQNSSVAGTVTVPQFATREILSEEVGEKTSASISTNLQESSILATDVVAASEKTSSMSVTRLDTATDVPGYTAISDQDFSGTTAGALHEPILENLEPQVRVEPVSSSVAGGPYDSLVKDLYPNTGGSRLISAATRDPRNLSTDEMSTMSPLYVTPSSTTGEIHDYSIGGVDSLSTNRGLSDRPTDGI